MKRFAIVPLLALILISSGCGSNSTNVQTASGGLWQSVMTGGIGDSSGFSFVTQFTVSGGGALSISNFQLENQGTCFATGNTSEAGTLNVTYNSADQVTGTFSFTITSAAGDVVTLTSTSVTGTINTNNNTLSGGTIIGTWALVPASGSQNCVPVSSETAFTMTQTTSG